MSYRPSFQDVHDLEVTVEVRATVKNGQRTLEFEPKGELRIEEGIEDVYDALETRYGWNRFLAEVRAQVLADIDKRLVVEVVKVETGRTSDDRQEAEDLLEFLQEHHPDMFD